MTTLLISREIEGDGDGDIDSRRKLPGLIHPDPN